jgi:uncharacterized protein RhaS with RHS repeats
LTPDPIGLEGGVNIYAYVQNNPVNDIDPYGLMGLSIFSKTVKGAFKYISRMETPVRKFTKYNGKSLYQ